MQTLTMRPCRGAIDLPAIVDLINTCDTFDNLDEGISITELENSINTPSFDKARDLRLWLDSDDNLIAVGSLWISEPSDGIDGFLSFDVHPNARCGGFNNLDLEAEIFEWSASRMVEVKQERGFPVKLRAGARNSQAQKIAALEKHGFRIDRYFFSMERSLIESIPEAKFPERFILRSINGEAEAQAWVDIVNEAFLDHWNHHPVALENVKYWMREPQYLPELDLIATAPDGTFAAFCNCEINTEDNIRNNRKAGYVGILGTRRQFRKMGLGRAILLAGLHRLKAAGMEIAELGVDADNPNGALGLYESVGFRKVYTSISYSRDV